MSSEQKFLGGRCCSFKLSWVIYSTYSVPSAVHQIYKCWGPQLYAGALYFTSPLLGPKLYHLFPMQPSKWISGTEVDLQVQKYEFDLRKWKTSGQRQVWGLIFLTFIHLPTFPSIGSMQIHYYHTSSAKPFHVLLNLYFFLLAGSLSMLKIVILTKTSANISS